MSDLIIYAIRGAYGIFPRHSSQPAPAIKFESREQTEKFLHSLNGTPATRHKLFLNYLRYVGHGDINMPEDTIIKDLAWRIESGDLQLVNLSGSGRAPGPTKERKYITPAAAKITQSGPEIKTARRLLAEQDEAPQRDYKIAVEVAGTGLEKCCACNITTSKVKPDLDLIDPKHLERIIQRGEDKHRYETEVDGLTRDRRWVWLDPGCKESDDACCPIPLKEMDPVSKDAESNQWPTVLIPLVPLAYTDADSTPELARPLRNGWVYIYVNGHIWRELYCFGDNTFRDVNLALPANPGKDVREPTGHKVSTVLVPHKIENEPQEVGIAFSEVQWPWHTICAMGGPADDDPRFLPETIANARRIGVDSQRRDKRFAKLDFSGYPNALDAPDGIVKEIEQAPCAQVEDKDPLKRYRDKKIAAVYLEDPLLVARLLAADYQQSWRDMETLLQDLAKAPEKAIKQKTYDPGRWFESALLANQFFYAAFPTFEQWRQLHPESDQKQWQKAKDHRDEMQSHLDKAAIDEALGVERRNALRPKIDSTKQALVDYLTARTQDELDLFMLMLDDYFLLTNAFGTENEPGKNPYGYVDGWSVMEQLIARLADHSHTLDVDMLVEPPNTYKLTQEDKGAAFLNTLADPDQNHPLHTRLFPKPGPNAWTPDTAAADLNAPQFKPRQFESVPAEHLLSISAFAAHFAKSALIPETLHVQQSIVRLTNCALKMELAFEEADFETAVQHAEENALSPEETQAQIGKALKGELTTSGTLGLMRRNTLFLKGTLERGDQLADDAAKSEVPVTKDVYSDGKLSAKAIFDPELKKGYKVIEESVDGKSCVVKRPIPGADKGVIHLPDESPLVGLKVLDPNGEGYRPFVHR